MGDENLLTREYNQPYSQTSRGLAFEQKNHFHFTFNFIQCFINILVPKKKTELEKDEHNLPT